MIARETKRIWAFLVMVGSVIVVVNAQDIIYPTEEDTCKLPDGSNGICKDHRLCSVVYEGFPAVKPKHCGFQGYHPIVCCPVKTDRVKDPDPIVPLFDITPPTVDFECGDSTPTNVFVPFGLASNRRFRHDSVFAAIGIPQTAGGVGGLEARRVLSKYTALIGSPSLDDLEWVCTGVLINHLWVLSAGHCAVRRNLTTVRLGEHDFSTTRDRADHIDFTIVEEVIYPEYFFPQQDHDLVLLRLSSPVSFGPQINPVCLPWGSASSVNLINKQITLTGWGATQFGGALSPLIQEVNVTVLDNAVCIRSYSELRDFSIKWPQGIRENVLCAGDPEGGKDACAGDSGGPVTYLDSNNRYVLAGTVSSGKGCGLKDFPGLYANMNHPPYLEWIKKVAFV